ncbi:ubiquinone biosynthesis protein UbiA [Flagellimonas taeanensis]|uniref:4-hydroxybenzoate polyprenyltransferase n=1 Tax=Flagellimonas taeanensis TaxID=1005926 RepID=A0A1M6PEP9_9FLAO|nr:MULTISPECIES: geranylgeranylglycerol-phosphate geranylgeranyltransferase [Allomuricauda]MDC6385060.1 geranylgeranylglycerol-phosphate geranylgeranyltransferase [Muricauda sp. SK9]MEE1961237.1 geranylgeranylglycerol-phosphate geranylgeranyltransferase [Allomuricauda taeanensis]RIV48973.1 ubiquinone biosynthesis protein UbiA [Allomuricauda taeanensis]SFB66689.1 4-hydroxybenzoate polyprenyltransferase [Allomuricauda taeanensis]SHK06397.1 4-hydroxybenzoate polyprenyltransferase [Allomuricauda t
MLSRKNKLLLFKLLSLFSVVRGYNILVITLAQYLASIYILSSDIPLREVVFDLNLFLIVTASALTIASGYIINNFYDAEKDLINKPTKSMLDRLVSQRFKLTTYFILNFLAVFVASYISFKAVLFFSAYIFGIWFYSHKLKRIPFVGNLVSSTLAIAPFFVVFVYYQNFKTVIFVHALFLFLLILAREMIKDLENMAGDMAQNYRTIPIIYGPKVSKSIITFLIVLTLVPALLLIKTFDVGHMYFYFMACIGLLVLFLVLLWISGSKIHYVWLHNILKFIIVAGVFSILLIDLDLVLNRIL